MSNYTVALVELVYSVTCQTCGKRFYLKVEPEDSIPSIAEVLLEIGDMDCSSHPHEDNLMELQSSI